MDEEASPEHENEALLEKSVENSAEDLNGVLNSEQHVSSDAEKPSSSENLVHRRKPEGSTTKNDEVETEEFVCSVCLQLAVLPTTLTCGHTSCRFCLAQWYFSSKKKECPLCKAPYHGHPKINTQLRNLLVRLYPSELKEREKEVDNANAKSVISKYDKELSKESSPSSSRSEVTSFFSGIIVASCIFVMTYLAWYWKSYDESLLVNKPVIVWTPKDVETWLNEIPWAEQYAHLAQEKHIDGRLLLSVNEEDLSALLNITVIPHARAFMLLIDHLHDRGVKMPATLWEYKAIYPGRCLFLVFGLKDFPRTTIMYLWLYFREDMYYPFVVATQEDEETASMYYTFSELENATGFEPTDRAYYGFLYYTVLMPEYLIGVAAYKMFKHHFFTPMFVLATLICRLMLEVLKIKELIRNRSLRKVYEIYAKQHTKHLISAFMFMVLWPILPTLICDVFFYTALYVSPIQMMSTLYTKLQQPQPLGIL